MITVLADFEMQPINKRKHPTERRMCGSEIIEIGAVMLDDEGEEIDSYKAYVKPIYTEQISQNISNLTGITQDMVIGADDFSTAIEAFAVWCKSRGPYHAFAWSDTDLHQITNEIMLKDTPISSAIEEMIFAWNDLQLEFDMIAGNQKQSALWRALNSIGFSFEGDMHDALPDARNSAIIYRELQEPEKLKETLNRVKEELEKSMNMGSSLGSLFDFSSFGFEVSE